MSLGGFFNIEIVAFNCICDPGGLSIKKIQSPIK